MENSNLSSVFKELFTEPIHAVVEAEVRYRQIWFEWLNNLNDLLAKRNAGGTVLTAEEEKEFLRFQLDLAPVMRLDARIEVGVSLRISSMKQTQGGGSVGLQLSVLQAAGSFSFASQETQESIMHARATYALSNNRSISLKEFLESAQLPLEKASDFSKSLEFLQVKK